jgi:HK97 family phage portal protein
VKLTLTQRFRAAVRVFGQRIKQTLEPVSSAWSALARAVGDWTSGAWQQVREAPDADDVRNALTVALVYDCVRRIATDIAKMAPGVRRLETSGVWVRATHQVFDRLIYRPNHFQTWFQFIMSWVTCRNIAGNAYVAKLYGVGGIVQELIVLDPTKVTPLVAHDTGAVFYRIGQESLAAITEDLIVAAADLIHDRYMPLGHPLVGTSPLDRALSAATARGGIMDQAGDMAANSSVPPGLLIAPEGQTEAQLKALAEKWRAIPKGRIAVIDAAYKFEALAAKYVDSQAAEIAELAGTDICAAFGVPPWKAGLGTRPVGDIEALQIMYFQDCLQWQVEEIEQCLDRGLDVPAGVYIELDPCSLFKLDSKGRAEVHKLLVGSGVMAPNEARREWDLGPVKGGESPYLQQQNYSLSALAARDAAAPAPSSAALSPAAKPGAGPETDEEEDTAARKPSTLLPWAGVWRADGEYPVGCFTTHKGSLWAMVSEDWATACGQEPGTESGSGIWRLAVKRGEAPAENT